MTVVLVPVSRDHLAALREHPLNGPVSCFAATVALYDTFGLADADEEEADRTALLLAGLSALMSHGKRLVLVAEADPVDDGDPLGEVAVARISWHDVSAFFADATDADLAVASTARAVDGLDLDTAWDTDEAHVLMAEHDLLWYGPEELDAFLAG